MATPNLFEKAQVVEKKASGKKDIVVEVEGLEDLTTIKVIEKTLKSISSLYEEKVKSFMREYVAKKSFEGKTWPANIKGTEGNARGSLQFRKRSSASGLDEMEQAVLAKYGISTKVSEAAFVINAKYNDDTVLLQKVSDAISKIKDLPDDFIQKTTTKVILTDESLNEVSKLPLAAIREVVTVCSTMVVSPRMVDENNEQEDMDINEVLKKLKKLLT